MMLKADGPAVMILCSIDCKEACVTAAVRTSLILEISTLELLICRVACKAGSSCRRRLGSCNSEGIGDCGTGDTGTVEEEEEEAGGAVEGFSPGADDVEGVVQDGLSADDESFLSDFCAGMEDVGIGSFDKAAAPFASNDFFGGGWSGCTVKVLEGTVLGAAEG